MSKDSSAKYNQDNKERQQKKACERYQSLSKEEKEKKVTIWSKIQNDAKIYQQIKNKSMLSIKKNITK